MRFVQELAATPPLDQFYGPLIHPGPDGAWEQYIQDRMGNKIMPVKLKI